MDNYIVVAFVNCIKLLKRSVTKLNSGLHLVYLSEKSHHDV